MKLFPKRECKCSKQAFPCGNDADGKDGLCSYCRTGQCSPRPGAAGLRGQVQPDRDEDERDAHDGDVPQAGIAHQPVRNAAVAQGPAWLSVAAVLSRRACTAKTRFELSGRLPPKNCCGLRPLAVQRG